MSRILSSLLLICCVIPALHSCKSNLPPEEAIEYGRLDEAIKAYESDYKSARDQEKRKELAAKLASLYQQTNQYGKAEVYYSAATRDGALDPITYYRYAQVLKSREKFEEAVEQLKAYKEQVPGAKRIDEEIELCEKAAEWQKNPVETRFKVDDEGFINDGKAHDYAPVITQDGLIFSSNRAGDKDVQATGDEDNSWRLGMHKPDLYIARKQRGRRSSRLQKPEKLETEGVINTNQAEGAAALDYKGKTMIYTSCNRPYEEDGLDKNDSNCVLMIAERRGRNWAEPERMPFCTDSSKHVHYGHPSLSDDEKRLYFASNMPGGYGGYDIYMSTYVKRSKTWSDPINLGPEINTEKDEMYPHAYRDEGLYFASNGHPGLGGLDLFVSYGRGKEWSKPENLLAPMNSGSDDFAVYFERNKKEVRKIGDHGYFTSNRNSNLGIDNIYSFNVQPLTFTVSGYVYNEKTKEVIPNSRVTLVNEDDSTKVFVNTDANGYYFMKLLGETNYSLNAYKEKFENFSNDPTVSTYDYKVSKDFERDMYLKPMRPIFELDIQYPLDKAIITDSAALVLDSFIDNFLRPHYYTKMELSSHTDCRGSDKYNEELAQRRAESALNYIVSKGIERERFEAKGYGEYKPKKDSINGQKVELTCDYIERQKPESYREELHQKNRRTEIEILSYDYEPKNKQEDELQEYVDPDKLREQMLKEMEEEEGGN